MKALVIIPTYNERDNIEPLVRQVVELGEDISVLVVDDNSPDGTGEHAEKLSGQEPRISVLRREGKLGLGTAHLAGFSFALAGNYDRIITMDGDFSHNPRYIPSLIRGARNADIVIGSRYVPGGGVRNWWLWRRLLSRGANCLARKGLRLSVHDCTSGFRCYRREVIEKLSLDTIESDGYSFIIEILCRCIRAGFSPTEIPIVSADRERGKSKISKSEILKGVFTVFRLWRDDGRR